MKAIDEIREHHNNRLEERLVQFMATVTEDLTLLATATAAVIADDEAKTQKITDLEAQVASLDPNAAADLATARAELAAVQAQVETLTAQLTALLPPPVPEALVVPAADMTGNVGAALASVALTAAGGVTPYHWTATGLPDGVTVDDGGNVAGTPTIAGTTAVTVNVSDSSTPAIVGTGTLNIVVS